MFNGLFQIREPKNEPVFDYAPGTREREKLKAELKRMLDRGFGPEEARKRIKAQMPLSEKVKFADFVIQNDGSLEETREQVQKVFAELSRLKD